MRVWMAVFLPILLTACSYHLNKESAATTGDVPSFSQGQLSYAIVNQYVFTPKCVQCHGHSGGVNLETFAAVTQNLTAVEGAVRSGSMPKAPAPPLTANEAQLLADWIAAGAPEQASGGGTVPPPPALEPKFSSIHDQVFAKKCLLCHNGAGSAKDVPLDTAQDLLTSPDDLVLPGDPDNSYLAIVISPGARRPMPPPRSGLTLTNDEVNVIKEWIKNGAKD